MPLNHHKESTGLFIHWKVLKKKKAIFQHGMSIKCNDCYSYIMSLIPKLKMITCFSQMHNPHLSLVRAVSVALHLQRDKVCWSKCVWGKYNWNPPKDAHGKFTAVVRRSYQSGHWCTDQHILPTILGMLHKHCTTASCTMSSIVHIWSLRALTFSTHES